MKAVIVDIKGKYAIALSEQGEFIKIRNSKKYRVGCETNVSTVVQFNAISPARIASIAAAFFIVVGLGCYSYAMPYAYVSMDINPSVELAVNIYDRIIGAEGLNEDGERLLSSGGYKNKKLSDGVEALIDSAVKEEYLKENQANAVVLSVSSKDQDKAEKIGKEIESKVAEELMTSKIETELVIENTTLEKHEDARMMGISPGKLSLIGKLIDEKPELKVQDLKDAPVKQIMKSIKEAKKAEKSEAEDSKISEEKGTGSAKKNSSELENGNEQGKPEKVNESMKNMNGKEDKKVKEGKEDKESKESKEAKEAKEAGEAGEDKEAKEAKEAEEAKESKKDKEDKENKEINKSEKPKESGLSKGDTKSGKPAGGKDKNRESANKNNPGKGADSPAGQNKNTGSDKDKDDGRNVKNDNSKNTGDNKGNKKP